MVQSLHLERMLFSWSPASQKKTLDLFCCSIQGGKSVETVLCANCTTHWAPPCGSFVRQAVRHVCVCERKREGERGEWCDRSELKWAGVHLRNRPKKVEERQVTLSQIEITLVCQTSALLSNPHTVANNPSLLLTLPVSLFVSLADSLPQSVFVILSFICHVVSLFKLISPSPLLSQSLSLVQIKSCPLKITIPNFQIQLTTDV